MNYRHIFHAGNRCDVVKHAALVLLLRHVREKDKPFAVMDTHAGIGLYDLQDPRAGKTREAQDGILRFLSASPLPLLDDYYAVLHKFNPGWDGAAEQLRYYPGSPLIALHMMRAHDRLTACELHEEDAITLRRQCPDDKRLHIHHRDGYAAMKAFLPPPEKRGAVLIDPPYEQADEFEQLTQHVIEAHRRWPTGTLMIWYPVKDRPTIWTFHERLRASGIAKILAAEFIYEEELRADRLNGCGLIIVNPPWKLDEELAQTLPLLHQVMLTAHRQYSVQWLNS
jgi:23S rRNA (adenine2030-N6)-methyltransferase